MADAKDDEVVDRFMMLYARLRDWTDEDPDHVVNLSAEDPDFAALCRAVWNSASELTKAERRERRLFTAPVDPNFVKAWRDYERRYSHVVNAIPLADLFNVGIDDVLASFPRAGLGERRWQLAADKAREATAAIDRVFEFAEHQIRFEEEMDYPSEGFVEEIELGISEWESLTRQAGFDLEGIIRRRELVPFVLIPRHVSRHHGDTEKLSLLTHLQQAHEAFVCGVPFAAIALLRSIMEATLKDHYGAAGKDLEEYISFSGLALTVKQTLHKLRQLANDIMHFNKMNDRMPSDIEREPSPI
jgi:hypothetical protein